MLDELFSMLQNLRASLSPSVATCLNSVIKLKNEGWGMSNSTSTNSRFVLYTFVVYLANRLAPESFTILTKQFREYYQCPKEF